MGGAELVATIVETVLDGSVQSCRPAGEGAVADTYAVTVTHDGGEPTEVICKCGGANIWSGDVIEPFVVGRVHRNTSLPVPQVLATGSIGGGTGPDRFALYEALDGRPGTQVDTVDTDAFYRDAGRLLGRLHRAFPYERIGQFRRDGDGLVFCEPTRRTLLANSGLTSLPMADDESVQPVLDHGDYFPGNVLVERGRITGLVDWGNAHVTHAGYALARAEARFVDIPLRGRAKRSEATASFRAGYRESRNLPQGYQTNAAWYKGIWVAQSGLNLAHVARRSRGRLQLRRQLRNWFRRRC